jgi:16S rRNA (adenine1518-N6/adenine1519-N6)-dimethyltransferase
MTRAKKRFGQHFLEPAWVAKVLRVIDPKPTHEFLEIGPGRGALTIPLAEKIAHLTAFEIDTELAAGLSNAGNLTIVRGDFLEVSRQALEKTVTAGVNRPLRVAGNLPYNVASPILFKLVDLYREGLPISDATVMLQREVAERLLAKPGTGEYGVLRVLVGRHADISRLLDLPPGAFRPMPKVHSTVVRLAFRPAQPVARSERTFEALTKAIFTRRRKTLANALRAFPASEHVQPAEALAGAALDGMRRPETLTIEELVRLADVFGKQG